MIEPKSIEIVQFAPWHVETMNMRDITVGTEFASRIQFVHMMGPAITILHAGRPMASIGAIIITRGTAEVWVIADRDVARIAKSLHRTALWAIGEARRRYRLTRIQAAIEAGNVLNRRWAERLGFVQEGEDMLNFGPNDEPYVRYVLLR